MDIVKPAAIYFATVFAAGFLLAFARIPFLVPKFGVRYAELIEIPVMLFVIWLAARRLVRGKLRGATTKRRLAVGALALTMLFATEIVVGVAFSGRSPVEVATDKDPISGTLYYISLVVFAVMPAIVGTRINA